MKNVSRQRYMTPETHGSATATRNGRQAEVVCLLFLYLWCGVYCTQSCSVPVPFFFDFSDQIRSTLGSIYGTASEKNKQHIAVDPRKKMMKETQDNIQTLNYYAAEKIEDPRLLPIGRKNRRKRSATKTQYGAI
jgi:hypothetical protein